jgi:GTP:adenosylcobinamide-phosphate guanylyltransferase
MTAAPRCTVLVLAAQRAGMVNPLAERAGVSHKCIVPICGKPLRVHVLDALAGLSPLPKVRISVEPAVHSELAALLAPYRDLGMTIEFVASSANIAESVLIAAEGQTGPIVITTADNVLLTPGSVEEVLQALRSAEVLACMATEASVKAVHPDAQRNFYRFRDGGYANCNLYAVAGPHAFSAIEVFREGGQFMKNPRRLVTAFGLFNILLVRFGLVTLERAMKLASRRFRLKFRALVFADGSAAVDVDNERTYNIAEMVLKQRLDVS